MESKAPAEKSKQCGQAAVEYILMLALTSFLGMFVMRYFVNVVSEGVDLLSKNVGVRLDTGKAFEP